MKYIIHTQQKFVRIGGNVAETQDRSKETRGSRPQIEARAQREIHGP
jgi:hypothetical protein